MGTSFPPERRDSGPRVLPSFRPAVALVAILVMLGSVALVLVLRPRDEPAGAGTAAPTPAVTDSTDVASVAPASMTASPRPSPAYANGAISFDYGLDVWIMEADGDDARLLVAGAYGIGWSPDGSRLLVVVQDPTLGGEAVAVVEGMDDDPRVLGPGSQGAWSPDGEMVAISDPFGAEV